MAKKTFDITLTAAIMHEGRLCRAGDSVRVTEPEAKNLLNRGRGHLANGQEIDASGQGDDEGEYKGLAEHTVAELKEIAESYEIEGFDGMKKAELIAAIEAVEADPQ